MFQGDYDEFEAILKQLSEAFAKKRTNELTQAYWKALKDLPLTTVARMADTHLRYGKFFPKPAELRPKDAPPERKDDPGFEAANQASMRNWDLRLRQEPLGTKWLLLDALCARIDVMDQPGSLAYHERMEFCRAACKRLLDESDLAYIGACPIRIRTVGALLGGEYIGFARDAYKQSLAEKTA